MVDKPYAPNFMFANPVGPWMRSFAWLPRRMWDGRVVWLKTVWCQRMVVHWRVTPGGGDAFWRWTDYCLPTPAQEDRTP